MYELGNASVGHFNNYLILNYFIDKMGDLIHDIKTKNSPGDPSLMRAKQNLVDRCLNFSKNIQAKLIQFWERSSHPTVTQRSTTCIIPD